MELLPFLGLELSTLILLIVFCGTLILWWRGGDKNAIPGPIGLPYIGNMLDLIKSLKGGELVEFIDDLHNKYGPICTIKAGVQRFIYIKDGKLLAELYQREEFTFRPVETFPVLKRISHGTPRGLVSGNGEPHKEMRRFALLSLRDFGVGKKSLDDMIQTEAAILRQHLEKLASDRDGLLSDLKKKMQNATANILHHIVFGHRYDYDDPKWIKLIKSLNDLFAANPLAMPQNFLPFLEKIPLLNSYLDRKISQQFFAPNAAIEEYIDSQIEDHRSTYCEGEIRDFIDLYLKYELEHKEFYTKANIFAVMLDLFRAGTDTTATTLTWCVMYLVKEQDIQRQLREEIDEVVGGRTFDRRDKDKLVKTRAFLNEIHRYVSIAPVIAPHTVTKPVKVKDYTFMPDNLIFGSLFSMHHDKDYWGDPYTFRIERWLNDEGELLKHDGYFLPFSLGKRACPGRQLATIEVMLILVEFLQHYMFERAEGYDDISDQPAESPLRQPKSFHFKVVKRH